MTTPAHTCCPGCVHVHSERCEAIVSSDFACGCMVLTRIGPCTACDLETVATWLGSKGAQFNTKPQLREAIGRLAAKIAELEASESHYRGNYLDAVERLKESTRQLAPPVNAGEVAGASCATCHYFDRETDTCIGPHPANGIIVDAPAHFHCSLFVGKAAPPVTDAEPAP